MGRCLAGLLLLLLLASCWSSLDGPGAVQAAAAPVVLQIWESADMPPRVLVAQRVEQLRDGLSQTHCFEVVLRIPLRDGELALASPHAIIEEQGGGIITLMPPIHLSGAVDGWPLQGRARSATLDLGSALCTLDEGVWLHMGQLIEVDQVVVRDEWRERRASRPRSAPAPMTLVASQAALPSPLRLPPWRGASAAGETGAADAVDTLSP
ncbi:MAG: hypothetical protein EA402_08565 [Planctomycetota bacterium]|nr:MAG: hypothetical protein EA402_08565 [Planctomycetota bacterium]